MDLTEPGPRKRTLFRDLHGASIFDDPPVRDTVEPMEQTPDASLMDIDTDLTTSAFAPTPTLIGHSAIQGATDQVSSNPMVSLPVPPQNVAPTPRISVTSHTPEQSTSEPPAPLSLVSQNKETDGLSIKETSSSLQKRSEPAPPSHPPGPSASPHRLLERPEALLTYVDCTNFSYAQILFNVSIVLVFLYLLFSIVWTIQRDVSLKVKEYELDFLGEIAQCSSSYSANRCGSEMQAPALADSCEAWRRCAARDPMVVGRARVTAETFAEILNGFVDAVSWKTMLFSLLTLSIVVGATNSTLSFFRVNASQGRQEVPVPYYHYVPPPPWSSGGQSRSLPRDTNGTLIPYHETDD